MLKLGNIQTQNLINYLNDGVTEQISQKIQNIKSIDKKGSEFLNDYIKNLESIINTSYKKDKKYI